MSTLMNSNNELPSPGTYGGIVAGYKDLGLVSTIYGLLHKVILSFKIRSKDKSHQIDRRYTYSLDRRSHLARDISILLGRHPGPDFDPKELIGTPCQLHLNIQTYPDQSRKVRILGLFPAQPRDPGLLDGFSIEIRKHPLRDL
jgi:hypothetical protein